MAERKREHAAFIPHSSYKYLQFTNDTAASNTKWNLLVYLNVSGWNAVKLDFLKMHKNTLDKKGVSERLLNVFAYVQFTDFKFK